MIDDEASRVAAYETWYADDDSFVGDVVRYARDVRVSEVPVQVLVPAHTDDEARLKIAACAPEALRMLLGFEWLPDRDMVATSMRCPRCGACQGSDHAHDCPWLALMVKAGLR